MHKLYRFFSLLSLLLLAACSATGADFQPVAATPGKGVVHVYRTSNFWGYGDAPQVTVDGKAIGTLRNAGFLTAQVEPGTHVIEVRTFMQFLGGRKIKVNVEPGGKYYYKVHSNIDHVAFNANGPLPVSSFHINPVSQGQALAEIQQTKKSN
jgi:hypothetical protein